jgi:hypothetical protein
LVRRGASGRAGQLFVHSSGGCDTCARSASDLRPRQAFFAKFQYFVPPKDGLGSSDRSPALGSLCSRATQPGPDALDDPDSLLFGYGAENRDDRLFEHAAGVELRLREASVGDPIGEPVQVLEGR